MPGPKHTEEWVAIARITRSRGNRGEVSAISLSDHPERFQQLEEVLLFGAEASPETPVRFTVEEIWHHGARLIFKFQGVDSISEADRLRNAEIRVPMEERFPLPEGEYYHSDLEGCEVVERTSGETVGVVERFLEQGGNGMLQVKPASANHEILIPFIRNICVEIDVEAKRIVIDPPEGLLELNS